MAKPEWLTASVIVAGVALLTGGLGGAVFTAWWTQERPTILTHLITTTSTGTSARSVVPNLSLRIGDRDISALHTHTIDIWSTERFVGSVELAVIFPEQVEMFGMVTTPPTPVHKAQCSTAQNGVTCTLAPLDRNGRYRLELATDTGNQPTVTVVGDNIVLTDGRVSQPRTVLDEPWFIILITIAVAAMAWSVSTAWTLNRSKRRRQYDKMILDRDTWEADQRQLLELRSRGVQRDRQSKSREGLEGE